MNNDQNSPTNILVVDDSMLMRTVLQDTLLEAGFQVFVASDGVEALELLQKETIHLIVADLNMPRLDGLELTRTIRADQQLGKLPIILISATDTDEDRRLGLLYGANVFITKERPDLDSLAERIIKMLQTGADRL